MNLLQTATQPSVAALASPACGRILSSRASTSQSPGIEDKQRDLRRCFPSLPRFAGERGGLHQGLDFSFPVKPPSSAALASPVCGRSGRQTRVQLLGDVRVQQCGQYRNRIPSLSLPGDGGLLQLLDFSWFECVELNGRYNLRHRIAACFQRPSESTAQLDVCKVRAVPSEQVVHLMNCRDCNVQSIALRLGGNDASGKQRPRNVQSIFVWMQVPEITQKPQSLFGDHGIPAGRLINHRGGCEQLILPPLLPPPPPREALAAEEEGLPARAGRDVAHNGRLDVDGRFHFPRGHNKTAETQSKSASNHTHHA